MNRTNIFIYVLSATFIVSGCYGQKVTQTIAGEKLTMEIQANSTKRGSTCEISIKKKNTSESKLIVSGIKSKNSIGLDSYELFVNSGELNWLSYYGHLQSKGTFVTSDPHPSYMISLEVGKSLKESYSISMANLTGKRFLFKEFFYEPVEDFPVAINNNKSKVYWYEIVIGKSCESENIMIKQVGID